MTQGVCIAADPTIAERLVGLPATNGLLRPALADVLGCRDVVVQEVCGGACAGVFMVTAAPSASVSPSTPQPPPVPPTQAGNATSRQAQIDAPMALPAGLTPVRHSASHQPPVNKRATAFMAQDHAQVLSRAARVKKSPHTEPSVRALTVIQGDAVLVWGVTRGWSNTRRLRPELVKHNAVALLGDALDPGRWEQLGEPFADTTRVSNATGTPPTSGVVSGDCTGVGAGADADAAVCVERPQQTGVTEGMTREAQDVVDAATRLRTVVVPAFARHLEDLFHQHMHGTIDELSSTPVHAATSASSYAMGAGAGVGTGTGAGAGVGQGAGKSFTPTAPCTTCPASSPTGITLEGMPAALSIMKTVTAEAHQRGINIRCVMPCWMRRFTCFRCLSSVPAHISAVRVGRWLGLVRQHVESQPLRDAVRAMLWVRWLKRVGAVSEVVLLRGHS